MAVGLYGVNIGAEIANSTSPNIIHRPDMMSMFGLTLLNILSLRNMSRIFIISPQYLILGSISEYTISTTVFTITTINAYMTIAACTAL